MASNRGEKWRQRRAHWRHFVSTGDLSGLQRGENLDVVRICVARTIRVVVLRRGEDGEMLGAPRVPLCLCDRSYDGQILQVDLLQLIGDLVLLASARRLPELIE